MAKKQLRGIMSALSTPFDAQGKLNEQAFRDLIEGELAAGIHGLIPNGSTGEFPALTNDERKRVAEITVDQAKGRVPVAVQTGATSTALAIELSKHAASIGADAIMVVQPYYEPMSLDEVQGYFQEISDAADLPIMVYNIPSCTGMNLPVDFLAKLAREVKNVKYIKDSSGDLNQVQDLINNYGDILTAFNGWDTITFSGLALGSKGSVWGAANCMPKQCADLFNLCEAHKWDEAKALWDKMFPVQKFLVTEGYVASVKAGANMLGFNVGEPRKPFRPLSDAKKEELRGLLTAAGAIREAVTA